MDKLALLPPLAALCSNLLLHHPIAVQGPSAMRPYNLIYHPPTSTCVLTSGGHAPPVLGPCSLSDLWYYTPQHFLTIKGTYFCLQPATAAGEPARLRVACYPEDSQWERVPGPVGSRLATGDGKLCLDVGPDGSAVVTSPCAGIGRGEGQWFEILDVGKDGRVVGEPQN